MIHHDGYIDTTGKIIFPPVECQTRNFSEGVGVIIADPTFTIMNTKGEYVLSSSDKYSSVDNCSCGRLRVKAGTSSLRTTKRTLMVAHEGKNLYGFLDRNGNEAIEARFNNAKIFKEGVAAVEVDRKWGLIDTTGKWIIKPKYKEITAIGEGFIAVEDENGWGFVDLKGKMVIEPQYRAVKPFSRISCE